MNEPMGETPRTVRLPGAWLGRLDERAAERRRTRDPGATRAVVVREALLAAFPEPSTPKARKAAAK